MKRLHFLLAALGFGAAAKAQMRGTQWPSGISGRCEDWTPTCTKAPTGIIDRMSQMGDCGIAPNACGGLFLPDWHNKGKPLNNQCPVCGTMAEPIPRNVVRGVSGDGRSIDYTHPEQSMVTRCLRCNAAFWQDAEK